MIRLLLTLICSFAVCVVLMPLVIKLAKKLKVRQTVLSYVDNHAAKSGTPTMGGLGFVLAVVICSFLFYLKNSTLATMVGIGLLSGLPFAAFSRSSACASVLITPRP